MDLNVKVGKYYYLKSELNQDLVVKITNKIPKGFSCGYIGKLKWFHPFTGEIEFHKLVFQNNGKMIGSAFSRFYCELTDIECEYGRNLF